MMNEHKPVSQIRFFCLAIRHLVKYYNLPNSYLKIMLKIGLLKVFNGRSHAWALHIVRKACIRARNDRIEFYGGQPE